MTYSCSDFADSILDRLGITLEPHEMDDPLAQANKVLAEIECLRGRDLMLKAIQANPTPAACFVIRVVGDVEPQIEGPYTEDRRDERAKWIRQHDDQDLNDGIYWLDIKADGTLEIGSYSAGFLEL